jgi:hypothetical protein
MNTSLTTRIAAVAGAACMAALALGTPAGAASADRTAPAQQTSAVAQAGLSGEWVAAAEWRAGYHVYRGSAWSPDAAKENALFNCRAGHPYAQIDCHVVDFHQVF